MSEPSFFIKGKKFQEEVRNDFIRNNKDGFLNFEEKIKLLNNKSGRMDILVSELGDFVAVYEIKSTNWDLINPKNIIKNAWSHQHQLLKYVDTYIAKNIDVCLGIIYPFPPVTHGLRERIEMYLENYGTPAYWFTEIKGK